MKKIILLLSMIAVVMAACGDEDIKENETTSAKNEAANVIAILEGDNVIFTDKEKLQGQLEKDIAKTTKVKASITSMSIDYSKATDDETVEIIQLLGSTSNETLQISYLLEKKKNTFSIKSESSTIICEGCRSGCSPRRKANGDGYCTPCDYQAKTCVKTETIPTYTN